MKNKICYRIYETFLIGYTIAEFLICAVIEAYQEQKK